MVPQLWIRSNLAHSMDICLPWLLAIQPSGTELGMAQAVPVLSRVEWLQLDSFCRCTITLISPALGLDYI
jgi:hypothetical protein